MLHLLPVSDRARRPSAYAEAVSRLAASATRCGWSTVRRRPGVGRSTTKQIACAWDERRRSEAALVRPRARRGWSERPRPGSKPCSASARRAASRNAAASQALVDQIRRELREVAGIDPRPRPGPAPSGSPDRRPIRSSFRRRAVASSLPSRCAAKIRLLAVTPEPQLATNGRAGSMPASANRRSQLVDRLEACRPRGRARRTAGCARRGCGRPRRRAADRARCLRTAALPRASSSGTPIPASSLLLGDDFAARSPASNRAARGARLAALGRPAFGEPFLEAAVEDRDLLGAEMAQHEPAARRGAHRRIVVDDDAVVAADAEPLHRRAELCAPRQHVRRRVRRVADLVDVEEARAGDVRREIFVAAAAPARRHVPARNRRRRGRARRDARASQSVETSESMARG